MMDVDKIVNEVVKDIILEQEEISESLQGWEHQDARDYVSKLYSNFGLPAVISDEGYAEWKNIAGFKRVSVRDEKVPHSFPQKHHDYVYSTREINVPSELYSDFANVTGSIIIDGLKKEVTARCGGIVANAVTLGFVDDVVDGKTEPTKDEYARRINELEVPEWFDDPMNEI